MFSREKISIIILFVAEAECKNRLCSSFYFKVIAKDPYVSNEILLFEDKPFLHDGDHHRCISLKGKERMVVKDMTEKFGCNQTKIWLLNQTDEEQIKVGNLTSAISHLVIKKAACERR